MASSTAIKAGYWFSTAELQVANIKSDLFTHLYAGFAKVQYPITPDQKIDDVIKFPDNSGKFESFPETVKRRNPHVKALLSIGGEGSDDISSAIAAVAGDVQLRRAFIKNSIQLAREHKYDGLDLCWLYPSNAEQMDLFAKLLEEWRQEVDDEKAKRTDDCEKLLLTAAVFHQPAIPDTDGNNVDYPCQAFSDYLDWINVLPIDLFTSPSPSNAPGKTGPIHAWLRFGKAGIENWIKRKVPTVNLVLGLPFHEYNRLNDDHDDLATKVKEAFRGINFGGYIAWHLAADDDNWILSHAASNAVPDNVINIHSFILGDDKHVENNPVDKSVHDICRMS